MKTMTLWLSQIKRYLVILGIAVFFLVSVFGLPLSGMNMNGEMIGCPFMDMGGMSICHMSVFEHISIWQVAFGTIVEQNGLGLLLILLVTILSLVLTNFLELLKNIFSLPFDQRHLRRKISHSAFLSEAFSSGILNPKLF